MSDPLLTPYVGAGSSAKAASPLSCQGISPALSSGTLHPGCRSRTDSLQSLEIIIVAAGFRFGLVCICSALEFFLYTTSAKDTL